MNSIIINNINYDFEEKEYKVNNQMSFSIKMIRYTEGGDYIICLCLLKTLTVNIDNKTESFKEIDKKLRIYTYLLHKENIDLIDNISLDLNNKFYYNNVTESDLTHVRSDSTNNLIEDLSDSGKHINITNLNKNCIITPNTFIENFEYIPIFHRNGPEKNFKSEIICHFRIVIDILMKVYSQFKHKILELSDLILNLTELKEEELDSYMNKSKSNLIKLLQEKTKELNKYKKDIRKLKNNNNKLVKEAKFRNTVVSQLKVRFHSDEMENLEKRLQERFDKADIEHQKAIELLRNELAESEFNANERFYRNRQESNIKTNKLFDAIQSNTKHNLNKKVTNPTNETKKCCSFAAERFARYLRVTVEKNYKNLPENSFVTLTVNRSQKRNLKSINLDTETVLLEENVANSIELFNNFVETSDINFIRTPTGININVTLIDTFINELKNYIKSENSRGTSEVLTSEVGVTLENNLILYEDVLQREYYIDHRYRTIYLKSI